MRKIIFITQFFLFLLIMSVYAEKVEKIVVTGNERISTETIIIFGEINLDEDFNDNKLNLILKNLYKTNYFEDIKIKSKKLDMITLNNLKFTKPDIKRFPSLKILKMITKKITLFETVLVSANDQLVDLFLKGKINFLDITIFLKKILRMKVFLKYKKRSPKNYNELINLSNYVRLKTRTLCI